MKTSVLSAPAVAPRRIAGMPLRGLVRGVSWVLIISLLALAIDAGVTLLWQEPVTAVVALVQRGKLDKRLLTYATAPLAQREQHALRALPTVHQRIVYLAHREQRQAALGQAIGQIYIPEINASYDVVQGSDQSSLEKGPGHYPATAFPGLGQTVAIAGHRTTYLAPFRHIDELRPGDPIVLKMPYGQFTYLVQYHLIVLPTALWVTRNVGYERLVLSASSPLYSGAQRIIVFARLRSVTPLGPARRA